MLTVEDALSLLLSHASALPPTSLPLAESLGCVLAEGVASDMDLPPFDKSVVDGYALRSCDIAAGRRTLRVVELVTAGQMPERTLGAGESSFIMTGAPLPEGADAVVMHEKTRREGDLVEVQSHEVEAGKNCLERGRELQRGDVVLGPGRVLSPVDLGLLASVGKSRVVVRPRPRVTVVPTGSELVEPGQVPGPGQIRNSNAAMLTAFATNCGADVRSWPIVSDDADLLRDSLSRALETDVLVITGGVSVGVHDLVPETLEALGVERVFHKVRLKPGKPVWFGVGPRNGAGCRPLVFGLPGNPVSGLVGFLVFVRPALAVLAGRPASPSPSVEAKLARDFTHKGDRPTYHPALFRPSSGSIPKVEPLDWAGSADLLTVTRADGFAVFPSGDRSYRAGEIVRYVPLS